MMYSKKSRRDRRMQTSNTALFFLEDDCIRAFGQETGCTLLQQAEELYQDLCQHGNDRGNHVIEEHLQSRLFPLMSYYKALLKHGIQEDQALLLVRETAHKAAIDKKAEMQKLGSLPFAYLIFRMGVKRHMKNHFPPEGWQTEWVRCDCQEIHFNLHRCPTGMLRNNSGARSCAVYSAKVMTSPSPDWLPK